ncbi:hypothetical protein [Polyangium sp. 15x6]|uniref:hypothetical protein n=1 Tax=Polyangium sp. 15x6 TaxID=3042687 RepID=UPI00249BA56C|nr:hypothetical protein [Polyangium sp. 15x6]MDI3285318.1 hypothetical protein [Polyangium sp. 15x6]
MRTLFISDLHLGNGGPYDGVLLCGGPALAQDAPASAPTPDANKELARERLQRGRAALFKQEAWGPALAEMLASLRLYPTASAMALAASWAWRILR